MRWPLTTLLATLLFVAGCKNNDLVEAELRTKENELREARDQLLQSEAHNEALQRELHAVHSSPSAKITPELGSQIYTLKEIVLGRQTGGYDDDDCPGDEALQVVLEPRDTDGHTIKAPGLLHVEVLEISPEGLKAPLSAWDVPPEQLRRTWRNGFLATGYYVVLPWKNWPSNNKLRVIARFTLADDRMFEADKDITIRLTPPAKRKPLPASPSEPVPAEMEVPLPAPQKEPARAPGSQSPRAPGAATPQQELKPASLWQTSPALSQAVQLGPPSSQR
jgi:hypothetical protein